MAFEVTLPELFTVSSQEYEALHGVWLKAVKVLPDYTVVHKQDIFVQEPVSYTHLTLPTNSLV